MATFNSIKERISMAIAALLFVGGISAQKVDCNLDFEVVQGCGVTGGYGLVDNITGGTTPFTIAWSTGSPVQFISGLANGSYSCTLSDVNGCSVTKYFTVDCTTKKEEDCQLRTQTMGGWGAKPAGKNPARYMTTNFAAAFPNGLTIGCENTLTLTNAQAVTNFLPSGTTPRALDGVYTNPGQTYRNVLAGQLVALTLSVGFDAANPAFGASATPLSEAVVTAGTFAGWSVQQVLNEANNFIGNCGSMYSAQQLNAVLDGINNNFVDGTANAGFLTCEKKDDKGEKSLSPNNTDRAEGGKVDCNLDFVVEQGCGATGGYALVTGIEGGTSPFTILWSNGLPFQYVSGLSNGSYSVTLSDVNGCAVTKYIDVDCTKKEEDCQLRTQTMGGWGAKPAGNNPARYMTNNFAAAFPNGLTIGCENTLTLTNALAVTNFLPSGTTPRALNSTYTNPGQTYRNVLAGQLVALTLSVGFDNINPNFGASTTFLANAVLNVGPFAGWTVQELLNEANNFIGGCGSNYSASDLNTALDMVNNNWVGGNTNAGFLSCDDKKGEKMLAPATITRVSAFPNPANNTLNLNIEAAVDGMANFSVLDAMGRIAMPTNMLRMDKGVQRTITLDVSGLANGTYLLNFELNGVRHMERIIVAH